MTSTPATFGAGACAAHWINPAFRRSGFLGCAVRTLALAIACIGAVTDAGARSLYVANSGNDQNPGTSLSAPLRTIDGAARVAQPGDVIELRAGSYTGATITRPGSAQARITLRPHNKEKVKVFSARSGRPTLYFYHATCDEYAPPGKPCQALHWVVEGLEIEGSGAGGSEDYVVKVDTPSVKLIGNNMWGSAADIVKLVHTANDVEILNNEIHHPRAKPGANAQGVDITGASRTRVAYNHVHDIPSIGMYAKGNARNTVFENNRVENIWSHGIMLGQETDSHRLRDGKYETYDGVIRNNIILNTGWSCFATSSSRNVRIYNNSCYKTGGELHGAVLVSNESEVHQAGTQIEIRNNIIHVDGDRPAIKIASNALTDPSTLTVDNNIYWSHLGPQAIRFTWRDRGMENVSFDKWRKTGQDKSSFVADPQYSDLAFLKIKPTSPAADAGVRLDSVVIDYGGANRECQRTRSIGAHQLCPPSR